MAESAHDYAERIRKEARHAYQRLTSLLNDGANAIRCIDENTHGGGTMVAGSILFFYYYGLIRDYFAAKAAQGINSVHIVLHFYCGFLFAVVGLVTIDSQRDYIAGAKIMIESVASEYGITVTWEIDPNGSARPHMS
ncbi:MAG: hypothetical protein UX62_C0038G0011 [Microgenomates group bacterium GW2011_GWA2_46_7]|nr:MAG: hypothetical protein UX62_C0038G0011 [Microgenomates group bacterium GW2011_GWA2_46_7]KKU46281.1 MAG: hypothetical protein UX64_C0009G0006 [Microgenomates group bacterium GW2011_GWC2_46_7]